MPARNSVSYHSPCLRYSYTVRENPVIEVNVPVCRRHPCQGFLFQGGFLLYYISEGREKRFLDTLNYEGVFMTFVIDLSINQSTGP